VPGWSNTAGSAATRAARASRPEHRLTGAAVLALLDTPWSRAVLVGALASAGRQDLTFECRAALRASRDRRARRAARRGEKHHPDDCIYLEFMGSASQALRDRMLELSGPVRRIRLRLPHE
jgi:hypothetical protein